MRPLKQSNERSRPSRPRVRLPLTRWVRRAHLYLGLLLVPWVFLFGVTALSFNHPTLGRGLETRTITAEDLATLSAFEPRDPEDLAARVSGQLGHGEYALVSGSARFSGWPMFVRPAPGGTEVVLVHLEGKTATLTRRPTKPEAKQVDFAGQEVDVPGFDLESIAQELSPLHQNLGIETLGPLRPHPEVHPELRFVIEDQKGTRSHVVFDLSTKTADGVPASAAQSRSFIEVLEALHTQHHYPVHRDITFFWALFADLLAATLIFWALSGLVMWWQLKKLRLYGSITLAIALALASLVMVGTARELHFGPAQLEQ